MEVVGDTCKLSVKLDEKLLKITLAEYLNIKIRTKCVFLASDSLCILLCIDDKH